jgi:hypothetical protein
VAREEKCISGRAWKPILQGFQRVEIAHASLACGEVWVLRRVSAKGRSTDPSLRDVARAALSFVGSINGMRCDLVCCGLRLEIRPCTDTVVAASLTEAAERFNTISCFKAFAIARRCGERQQTANLRGAREHLAAIKEHIAAGTFQFAEEFPSYRHLRES